MKRFFSYIGASLVAIAALSSCSKEIDNPSNEASNGIQFAITASSVDTKTSIDGFKTSWVANDKLDITHAIAGSTKYITDGSFSISEANLATNKFNGTLKSNLEEGSSYDWYALYPYTEKIIHTLDIPKVLFRMAIIAPHIYAERFALFMASLKM